MRKRLNVVLSMMFMLGMAFGVTAMVPSAVSAQTGSGTCQFSVSGDGEPNFTGTGLSAEECEAVFQAEFGGELSAEPGAACQVLVANGEVEVVQSGDCTAAGEPTETATATATQTATATATVTEVPATEVPATEVPATEVPATEVPATEVPVETEEVETEVAAPVAELPATGVGAQDASSATTSMLLGSLAMILLGGAFALRRRSI